MSAYDNLEITVQEKCKAQAFPHQEACLLSIAVSMKRIADAVQFNVPQQAAALTGIQTMLSSVITSGHDYSTNPSAIRTKSG